MAYYPQNNWYPQSYSQSYSPVPMQQMQPQPQTQGMIWVDGEVGAKAYQMPQGLPVGTPIALWDTNDQIVYLKSINQMGMPNPLQKIRYTIEEQPGGYLTGAAKEQQYVTKEDFDKLKNDIREMMRERQNGGGNT